MRALVLSCAALLAACPPFDALEPGAGEGEGEGEPDAGPAPECDLAADTLAQDQVTVDATDEDDQPALDLAVGADGRVYALLAGGGRVVSFAADGSGGAEEFGACSGLSACDDATPQCGSVVPLANGAVVVSGVGGACVLRPDRTSDVRPALFPEFAPTFAAVLDADADPPVVLLVEDAGAQVDLVLVEIEGDRDTAAFGAETLLGRIPVPTNETQPARVVLRTQPGAPRIWLGTEDGDLWLVDPEADPQLTLIAELQTTPPRGFTFAFGAPHAGETPFAMSLIDGDGRHFHYGVVERHLLRAGLDRTVVRTDISERVEDRQQFWYRYDRVNDIAIGPSGEVVTVGDVGFAAARSARDATPVPVGVIERTASLTTVVRPGDGSIVHAVTSDGAYVFWRNVLDDDDALSAAELALAPSGGVELGYVVGAPLLRAVDHPTGAPGAFAVLIGALDHVIEVQVDADGVADVADERSFDTPGYPLVVSLVIEAAEVWAILENGDVHHVRSGTDFVDAEPLVGTIDADFVEEGAPMPRLAATDMDADADSEVAVAGWLAGVARLRLFDVNGDGVAPRGVANGDIALPVELNAEGVTLASISYHDGVIVLLTSVGIVLTPVDANGLRDPIFVAAPAEPEPERFRDRRGGVVRSDSGCAFVTGHAVAPLAALDLGAVPPTVDWLDEHTVDPYFVEAILFGDELLGFGPGSAPIVADVSGACTLNGFSFAGAARGQLDLIRVVFAGDTAWASEINGNLWRLPRVCSP